MILLSHGDGLAKPFHGIFYKSSQQTWVKMKNVATLYDVLKTMLLLERNVSSDEH